MYLCTTWRYVFQTYHWETGRVTAVCVCVWGGQLVKEHISLSSILELLINAGRSGSGQSGAPWGGSIWTENWTECSLNCSWIWGPSMSANGSNKDDDPEWGQHELYWETLRRPLDAGCAAACQLSEWLRGSNWRMHLSSPPFTTKGVWEQPGLQKTLSQKQPFSQIDKAEQIVRLVSEVRTDGGGERAFSRCCISDFGHVFRV